MPDLLLELFSEEIPARMQRRAAEDVRKLVTDALVEAGLVYEGAKAFVTPRRLALTVHGVPARSPDRHEERKGPRVGAPAQAIDGFLKAAGLASIDAAKVVKDKKGDFYVAVTAKPGRAAAEVIAEIVPKVVRSFPWPKSMRWGERSAKGGGAFGAAFDSSFDHGSLRWVRPLHAILCTFGAETEEPEVVAFDIDGIRSGNVTHGHRFMAPEPIAVRRFDDYAAKLEKAKVVLDADRRKDIILHAARDQALALGLELIEDEGLLEEVAGLVEWPVVLTGTFEEAFLDIPPEVIRATIRANQKCFVLRDDKTGRLANRFVLVANIEASDGGKAIVAGNGRVIRARLSDARHFWETDRKPLPAYRDSGLKPLDQRLQKLRDQNIVFHEKLGTQGERVERIARLAREIAPLVGADPDKAERAANLAKADLVTEMVGEFPELQGLMGRYYAAAQGEDPSVAAAIEDHYKPVGPSDRVPTDPVAIAVALADKLDTLVGFWAIDEKPTGSKDPYALRRAALGVARIILSNKVRCHLGDLFRVPYESFLSLLSERVALLAMADDGDLKPWPSILMTDDLAPSNAKYWIDLPALAARDIGTAFERASSRILKPDPSLVARLYEFDEFAPNLLAFFADRLKVQLHEQGARHDLVDAVFALGQGTFAADGTARQGQESPLPGGERDRVRGLQTSPEKSGAPSPQPSPLRGEGAVGVEPQDDLLLIVRRVEALGAFLDTDDGKNLLAGYKRATNILRDEEKKTGEKYDGPVDAALLAEVEEKSLAAAIDDALPAAKAAVDREDYAAAMAALAQLRAPVDAFFDKVRVNDPDPAVRANRLRLLNRIREATLAVADFSKVGG